MYITEMFFKKVGTPVSETEDIEGAIYVLLGSLRNNGQVLDTEPLITQKDACYSAFIVLPDRDALDKKYNNKYVQSHYDRLKDVGLLHPKIHIIGEHITSERLCSCRSHSWFLLFTNYLSIQSPLCCGSCFGSIPLYRIPKTHDDEYWDVICWQSDYKACDSLQMGCSTGERFGMREMAGINSSLSKRGRAICETIMKSTGIPTYYYLYRYKGKSDAFERQRKCPSCGGDWLLTDTLHNIFDFKCDKCYLLSNIAVDVRY